ncbi:Deoxyribose-phosphate aldolase [Pyrodictium delaneyi]|uniref:Deoxyribose-phosphate aldolase n=2 Tax=Pyrodictium delaneyi TaxID=1273541 RepID=A0A0P0N602_9CREN|nr:Deoxyribose-phosphate aldolase [Pyrodictium delaneyi]
MKALLSVVMIMLHEKLCSISSSELASRIDHAILKPWLARKELEQAINDLEELNLRCLILSPQLLREAHGITGKCLGVVVGFPFGYHSIEAKIKELEDVIALGAREIDYVTNTQLYLLGRKDEYANEIRAVTTICREAEVTCKIIIETPALTQSQIKEVTRLVAEYEPDFIKTSTGFGPRHTLPDDIVIIDSTLRKIGKRDIIKIKAAGGIRTGLQAAILLSLGADVIGTSTPRQILETYRDLCTSNRSCTK